MKTFFKTISIPIILAVLNVVAQYLYAFLPHPIGIIIFNVVRLILSFWAGWLIVSHQVGGLWQAGIAGAVLFILDHIILRGGMFLVLIIVGKLSLKFGLMSFGGVIISFLMLVWIPFLIAVIGGYLGKRSHHRADATT